MKFEFDNNIPIYIQLLEYMKIYLISGVFKCGEKLPSVRDFANTFKVNPNTMQKALTELERLGLINTERTNGKFITMDTEIINSYKKSFADNITNEYIDELYEKYGIENFKLSGRTYPPYILIEMLVYYLVVPKYRDAVRQTALYTAYEK